MKTKIGVALVIIAMTVFSAWGQDQNSLDRNSATRKLRTSARLDDHYKPVVPPQEKMRKNPVRFTQLSVERGKKIFQAQCVLCHGTNADGKGDFARAYGAHPPDFTDPAVLGRRTDGELFYIIGSGTEKMPGKRVQLNDNQRWDVVNYLRSVEGKVPEQSTTDNGKTAMLANH